MVRFLFAKQTRSPSFASALQAIKTHQRLRVLRFLRPFVSHSLNWRSHCQVPSLVISSTACGGALRLRDCFQNCALSSCAALFPHRHSHESSLAQSAVYFYAASHFKVSAVLKIEFGRLRSPCCGLSRSVGLFYGSGEVAKDFRDFGVEFAKFAVRSQL